ncbi:MAG: transcriptional regulator [Spirochaetes bacterium GWF1_49_6]|jgi:nitrogen regulatory protein P-II 1|nr:MAG: transcriptional regulator [Spirochaetes bacterium GWF1_49_6]
MKKIEAIIRPEKLEAVVDKLQDLGYPGLNITNIQGHGRQKGMKEIFRGREYDIKFIQKVKIELVVPDEKVEMIVEAIIDIAKTGAIGDGKIFLYDIADAIRVRTKERGDIAL